jgi:hypothetical protein
VFNQLPADLRRKIAVGNAMRIYPLQDAAVVISAPGPDNN